MAGKVLKSWFIFEGFAVFMHKTNGWGGGFLISSEGKRERLPPKQAITAYVSYRCNGERTNHGNIKGLAGNQQVKSRIQQR
jgi:hypothetical protein